MSLASEYHRQFAWRDWPRVLDALPSLAGQLVLDLGCGVGDQAAELIARGARVIGLDSNEELLLAARARLGGEADLRLQDVRALPPPLRPVGWIALIEIDDLFGHEPLAASTRALLGALAANGCASGPSSPRAGRSRAAALATTEGRPKRSTA